MSISVPTEACDAFQNCISSFLKRKKKRILKQLTANNNACSASSVSNSQSNINAIFPKGYLKQCQLVTHLTNHAVYILTTLYTKRHSLSLGIEAFGVIVKECIECIKVMMSALQQSQLKSKHLKASSSLSFSKRLQEILRHLFIQYIHLRDGFVLLTSGECRHTADAAESVKNNDNQNNTCSSNTANNSTGGSTHSKKRENCSSNQQVFTSKLNELTVREDGYTKLFSSNCGYSGYGWDEFFNEEVGVRNRLLDALHCCSSLTFLQQKQQQQSLSSTSSVLVSTKAQNEREKIWDTLIEMNGGVGAQLFEAAFDTHDNCMKDLQHKLESIRKDMLHQLQMILSSSGEAVPCTSKSNVTLVMVTEDKFERLQLKNPKALLGLDEWIIERQGDAFKGNDKRGALPTNVTLHDWLDIMKIPSNLQRIMTVVQEQQGKHHMKKENNSIVNGNDTVERIKKKKKLAIMESSDEEDNDDDASNNNSDKSYNNNKTDCLKVTKTKVDATAPKTSLSEIKELLGVNAHALQQSREGLEEEERISKKAAFIDEIGEGDQSGIMEGIVPITSTDIVEKCNHHKSAHFSSENIHLDNVGTDVEFNLRSKLQTNSYNSSSSLPRNDLFRNASTYKEPTSRIVIGGDYRNSTYQQKKSFHHLSKNVNRCNSDDADRAFTNFGKEGMEEQECVFEEEGGKTNSNTGTSQAIQYRKWGDEVLKDLGVDLNSFYPACAPEKPPEMIREMGGN